MPLLVIRDDILNLNVDAIINPTDTNLSGAGSIDKRIHNLCGNSLVLDLNDKTLSPGHILVTDGYKTKVKYIIHACGPKYIDGNHGEEEILTSCYTKSLQYIVDNNLSSIAMPLLSTGTFKYPKEKAMQIANKVISKFLKNHDITIYLVIYDQDSYLISKTLYDEVHEYIDSRLEVYEKRRNSTSNKTKIAKIECCDEVVEKYSYSESPIPSPECLKENSISFNRLEDTFSVRLLKLIDKSGHTDPEIYQRANIDRRLFSKIRSDSNYKPSKKTAIALCIALQLNLHDAQELLGSAGLTLSRSSKFDIIIEFFIVNRRFDIYEINDTLFSYDLPILD